MADQYNTSTVSADRLEKVETLLQTLKQDAQQAHEDGDVYLLGVYNELLRTVSAVVVRAHARLEREERARFNKAHRELREQARSQQSA